MANVTKFNPLAAYSKLRSSQIIGVNTYRYLSTDDANMNAIVGSNPAVFYQPESSNQGFGFNFSQPQKIPK